MWVAWATASSSSPLGRLKVRAHITNYRSVEDSDIFDVERDVTCLVGQNESGKTTLLQALFRVNPVEPTTFDEVVHFPARKIRDRKQLRPARRSPWSRRPCARKSTPT